MKWFANGLCALAMVASTARAEVAPTADRPDVLFLFSDDQRFDTIHALGNDRIRTPNLDRLVGRGTAFRRAYCMGSTVGAVCAPSRAMLLTGRTLYRAPIEIPADLPTWPEVMRAAGYRTIGIGKWHNGPAAFARGFDGGGPVFFGGMSDHDKVPVHDFDPSGGYPKSARHPGRAFSSELFADAAIRALEDDRAGKPLFLYVAFTAPHDPRTPPGPYATMYDPEGLPLPANYLPVHPFDNGEMAIRDEQLAPWPRTPEIVRRHLADYYGMISHLDAQVGRILDALEASGRAERTLVVFSSDHGLAVGRHGLLGKQSLYEHSMRPPLIFAGPGVPAGRTSDAFCYLLDIFPTTCDLVGVPAPATVEGRSLAPILRGERESVRDSIFCAYRDVQRSVRDDRWKLIVYPRINKAQLFDLESDPDEARDLAGDPRFADRLGTMTRLLEARQREVGDDQPLATPDPAPSRFDPPEGGAGEGGSR